MTTRGVADIVFCLDASGSMAPCIDGVRSNINAFVEGLRSTGNTIWDLRLDFVAYKCASAYEGTPVFSHRSLFNEELWPLYKSGGQGGRFFTSSVEEFCEGLSRITVEGDESTLVALDFALDFPWRDAAKCHRVVILMTDEAFETGVGGEQHVAILPELIEKIQGLRTMLFLVTPPSAVYEKLSEVDKCEHYVVEDAGSGLAGVDFKEVLSFIGKSVSASTVQGKDHPVKRGLFGQSGWSGVPGSFGGK